jgi:hypothetical protein
MRFLTMMSVLVSLLLTLSTLARSRAALQLEALMRWRRFRKYLLQSSF